MTADTEPANRHVLNEDNWKNKEKVNVTFTFCFHIFLQSEIKESTSSCHVLRRKHHDFRTTTTRRPFAQSESRKNELLHLHF